MWTFSVCATDMTATCALLGANGSSMPALAEGTPPLWHATDVDGSREVIRQAREAAFSTNVLEPRHEDIARSLGVCERAKGVCNAWRSRLHALGVGFEPLLR
jgi:hypothetical protein